MSVLRTEHPAANKYLLQLFDHDRCVGTATVIRDYLDDITVYPEFRHLGYGQELLHACEAHGVAQAIVVSEAGRHLFAAAGWQQLKGARFEFPQNRKAKH